LNKTDFSFRYGPDGGEMEYDCESNVRDLWLYFIYVYGTPDVKAEISVEGMQAFIYKMYVQNRI
jgi:hypothetical protein